MGWASGAAYALAAAFGAAYLALINHEGADRATLWTFFLPTWWAAGLLASALISFIVGTVFGAFAFKRSRSAAITSGPETGASDAGATRAAAVASNPEMAEYRERLDARLGRNLAPYVELAIDAGHETWDLNDLEVALTEPAKVALVAASGAGKSHLARHLARKSLASERLVIWLSFDEYERGRLDRLLAGAVAPFTAAEPGALIALGAESAPPLLVVDAVDAAPAALQQSLFDELTALGRTAGFSILVTTTDPVVDEEFQHITLRAPDGHQITRLREAHHIPADAYIPEAFDSPFEISIAALCLRDLAPEASVVDLLDTYIRRIAPSEQVRSGLRAIAEAMTERVTSVLGLSEAESKLRSIPGLQSPVITVVVESPLLNVDRSRVRFAHEQLQKFIAAEAVVVRASADGSLGEALLRPQNRDLTEYALGIERDSTARVDALETIADASLLGRGLTGGFGTNVARITGARLDRLLELAVRRLPDSVLRSSADQPTIKWTSPRTWTVSELAYFRAAGSLAFDGQEIRRLLPLIDATDAHLVTQIGALQQQGEGSAISVAVKETYAHLWGEPAQAPATAIVVDGLRSELMRRWGRTENSDALRELFADVDTRSWGRLYLASLYFDHGKPGPADLERVPELIDLAWQAQGYHLRLEMLMAVHRCARALEGADRAVTIDSLDRLSTDNLFLSTQLVETLAAFGQIEPMRSLEEIQNEIGSVLADLQAPDAAARAVGVVAGIFEMDSVFGPYGEAFYELGTTDQLVLLALASRGDPSTMHIDWIMSELADGATAAVPLATDALVSMAGVVPWDDPMPQSVVMAHLHAIRGVAQLSLWRPLSDRTRTTPRERAWAHIDEVLVRMLRGESEAEIVRSTWSSLIADLPRATVEVLIEIHQAQATSPDWRPHDLLCEHFAEQIRELLVWALGNFAVDERLTRLFESPVAYAVRALGEVGDAAAADVLRQFTDEVTCGDQAVRAIRLIESRTGD